MIENLCYLRRYLYRIDMLIKVETKLWQTIPVKRPEEIRRKMQNFVISGKAKTVFRLIELKAKQEEAARREKKDSKRK
jgi:hypothetical protein